MVHYILLMALYSDGKWGAVQSDYIFRKQEVCQVVGEKLRQKHKQIKAFRCIKRTEV